MSTPQPAAEVSTKGVTPGSDRPQPVAENAPSAGRTPPAPRSGGEAKGGGAAAPAGNAGAPQADPGGWGSAIFAPKPTIVASSQPANPSVQLGALVESGPGVIDPVLVEHPELKYPKDAKKNKVEAVVRVRVLVDENGKVLEAKVEKPVGYGLDEVAVSVAQRATFIPATKETVRVKMWTVLPLDFRLEKK